MTFKEFVVKILESYISENPDYAAIYSDQINGIVSFNNEINGYGAYSHFTLKPDCLRFGGAVERGQLGGMGGVVRHIDILIPGWGIF